MKKYAAKILFSIIIVSTKFWGLEDVNLLIRNMFSITN